MPELISPARPLIGREERVAVDRVLRSGMLSQGSEVAAFEQEFASHFGLDRPCVAVSSGSYQLLRLIVQERKSPYHVVGFIDDAKGKRNLRMLGVPVLGGEQQLFEIAVERGVTNVILAITQADSELVRRVSATVEGLGLRLLVVPAVQELIDGRVHLSDVREVDIADILGRHQVETNVLGTMNVLQAATRCGCSKSVNISTDKAAEPTNVLGKTKRLAERLTAWYAHGHGASCLSVRNVLGSRGSMLHTFTTQIQAGGPVTVTHPDITRYFMTIPEACELTIQAAAIGSDGAVLVLDMGQPVRQEGWQQMLEAYTVEEVPAR